MLHNLMVVIQDYLLLSDDDEQYGALSSLALVRKIAEQKKQQDLHLA